MARGLQLPRAMASDRPLFVTSAPRSASRRQLLITTVVAILTAGVGCSFAASSQLHRGRVDCSNVSGARAADRATAIVMGISAAVMIGAGAVTSAQDAEEREDCRDGGGGPCEGSFLPGLLLGGGVLLALPAALYGVSASVGSDKLETCQRRSRQPPLAAATALADQPRPD